MSPFLQKIASYSLLVSIVGGIILFGYASPVQAAKPRIKKTTSVVAQKGVSYSSVKLSRGTNSIITTFTNLSSVSKVTYMLSYASNGIQQGVVGSLVPNGETSTSRDLYIGTCSKGVCTPHRNIKNTSLLITTQLKSGGTFSKRYTIKW